jgi:S-phase kinase-associated protein 1
MAASSTSSTEETTSMVVVDEKEETLEPVDIDWDKCFKVHCLLQDEEHTDEPETFQVPLQFLEHILTLKELLEAIGVEDVDDGTLIPLPNVAPAEFRVVIEFVEARLTNPCELCPVLPDRKVHHPTLGSWALNWGSKLGETQVFYVIMTANYLNVKELVRVCAQTIAIRIADKSPEELRQLFGEPDDLTDEEKEQLKKDAEWLRTIEREEGEAANSANSSK